MKSRQTIAYLDVYVVVFSHGYQQHRVCRLIIGIRPDPYQQSQAFRRQNPKSLLLSILLLPKHRFRWSFIDRMVPSTPFGFSFHSTKNGLFWVYNSYSVGRIMETMMRSWLWGGSIGGYSTFTMLISAQGFHVNVFSNGYQPVPSDWQVLHDRH